jgi:hypothetical protein
VCVDAGELSDEALEALGFIPEEKTYEGQPGSPPSHPVMQQQMQVRVERERKRVRRNVKGGGRGQRYAPRSY